MRRSALKKGAAHDGQVSALSAGHSCLEGWGPFKPPSETQARGMGPHLMLLSRVDLPMSMSMCCTRWFTAGNLGPHLMSLSRVDCPIFQLDMLCYIIYHCYVVVDHPEKGCVHADLKWLHLTLKECACWNTGPTPDVSFQGGSPQVPVVQNAYFRGQLKYGCKES